MGFDKKNIGVREEYFVARSNRDQGDQAYDDDGLPIYSEQDNIEFWGSVEDLPSVRTDYMGRYRSVQVKRIICDARDIELLTEDHTIQRDGDEHKYQVVDILQPSFKFTAELIIERIL
jgi:hypothetical protein